MRQRATASEWLDNPAQDIRMLADSFQEVWGVNRYLGGLTTLQQFMRPLLEKPVLTVVDVAGGTGEVICALAHWARTHGTELRAALVDAHPQVLAIARERVSTLPGGCVVPADARRLPFADGQFDVAICNLALHHFTDADAAQVLRELDRVSRMGWIVSDLERHPLAYVAALTLARSVWRNPITRHDGPLSVRRAFRLQELERVVSAAGVQANVQRRFPFRLSIIRQKG